jgi:hypothetical protein
MKLINLFSATDSTSIKTLFLLFVFANAALWLPAMFIPFWGDDYYFLMQAREARLSGASWLMPFMSESSTGFWRPLSMDVPWRIIETHLYGNPISAHIFSFLIWFISIIFIYLLSFRVSNALSWDNPKIISLVAASLYSFSAVHFLVLHWVSAINSSFLVIFICLPLILWVVIIDGTKNKFVLCLLMPPLQLLSLFCKELAILLPGLMLCISLFTNRRLTSAQTLTWLACIVTCIIWFYFFKEFTHNRHSSYEIKFGVNIIQNFVGLAAWMLNIPREAIRMVISGQILTAIIWIIPILTLMFLFLYFAVEGIKKFLSRSQLLAIIGFMLFGYGPYFMLSNQSYEYYAAVAIILPVMVMARGIVMANRTYVGLLVFAIASFVSIQGSRMLDYPSLIGRAYWAEAQFNWLKSQRVSPPLVINIDNKHKFYAMGLKGLVWQLSVSADQILEGDKCVGNANQILIQYESKFVLEYCDNK